MKKYGIEGLGEKEIPEGIDIKVVETFSKLVAKGKKAIGRPRESWQGRLSPEVVFSLSLEPRNIRLLG